MIPNNRRSVNPIVGVIGLVLFLIVIWYVIKGIFWLLWVAALPLFLITFFIDRNVIFDYVKWIAKLFKSKWYLGLGAGAATFFGYPFVSAFLFGKAMFKKKAIQGDMGKMFTDKKEEGDFTDYEEIDSEIVVEDIELEDTELDLPEIEENLNTLDDDNAYENLFGNKQ